MKDAPSSVVALRYMTRFACRAGECEDTCCQHWSVSIDEAHYRGLQVRYAEGEERARFEAAFVPRPPSDRTPWAFATIRMRARDDACPMLDPDCSCSVHRRFGPAALPDVCAAYPRFAAKVGERLEVTGSMSCPEVVRRALFDEDGVDLEEAEAALFGRAPVLHSVPADEAALVDELRGRLLMVLDRDEPLASRLYLAAWLAEAAQAALAEGGAGALAEELEAASDEGLLAELADGFTPMPSADGVRVLVAQIARLRSVARPALRAELDALVASADELFEWRGEDVRVRESFVDGWEARRDAIPASSGEALQAWLGRYARHYAFKEIVLRGRTLPTAVRELSLRIASFAFLARLHPHAADADALGRWLVRLVYQSARLAEHDAAVRTFLTADAEELLTSLDALPGLLGFVD